MSRISSTLLLIAFGLPLAGCDGSSLASPVAPDTPTLSANAGGAVVTQNANIGPAPMPFTGSFSGSATLVRNARGLWLSGQSDDFEEGAAYTIWSAIFENPGACEDNCNPPDLQVPEVQGAQSNFGGFVAGPDGTFEVHLARHDDSRETLQGVGRSGIDNPYQAEIHFIFRSHGPAETDADLLAAQISTLAASCNRNPGPGCQNQGLVIFGSPGAPGQGQ